MKQTQYTAEFKAGAVKQIIDKGQPAPEISCRLGVAVGLFYTWVRKHKGIDVKPILDIKVLKAEMTKLKSGAQAHYRRARYPKKGRCVLCQSVRVKYAFIKEYRSEFRLSSMCRVLKVHRSGYYSWLKEPQDSGSAKLSAQIRYYYDQSMGIYGSPRIYHDPKEAGISYSENLVARLMKASQLRSNRGYKRPRYRVDRLALVYPPINCRDNLPMMPLIKLR